MTQNETYAVETSTTKTKEGYTAMELKAYGQDQSICVHSVLKYMILFLGNFPNAVIHWTDIRKMVLLDKDDFGAFGYILFSEGE